MDHYKLPKLPYGYADLEPMYSRELLELHHGSHHAAYVDGANATLSDMTEARNAGNYAAINQLQKSLVFNLSGHVLHSLFWKNLSPDGGGEPPDAFQAAVKRNFRTLSDLKEQLSEAAKNLQGSGWASLAWDPMGRRLLVEQVYDHRGNIGNATIPILVLDLWEHAYYPQYRNDKAAWVHAFWDLVSWDDVTERYYKVRRIDLLLT